MNEPILCGGNDLAGVCADIRSCGGVVESLDAGVGGNAGWRVNYFDGGKTIAPKTPSGAEDSAQTNGGEAQRTHLHDCTAVISVESAPRTPEMGSNPMPTANYDRVTEEPQSVPGSARNAGHAGPASVPHFEPIPTGDILPQVKGGGLNADQQPLQSVPRACLGISIEDRIAALQERLRDGGKIQRSEPSTLIQHARSPYKDD